MCDRTTVNDLTLSVNESEGLQGLCRGCVTGCCYFWVCCGGLSNIYFGHESTAETLDTQESLGCAACLGRSSTQTPPASASV